MSVHNIQKRAVEYLIMSGSMDEFGDRNGLLEISPQIYERVKKSKSSKSMGQIDIFSLANNGDEMNVESVATPITMGERSLRSLLL